MPTVLPDLRALPLPWLRPTALLRGPRAAVAASVRGRIGGEEFAETHRQVFHSQGERWFTPDDPIWRVHLDASMFVGGIRALLLQSLHPIAMQGVDEHSAFRGDEWGRLQRTSRYLVTTTYGTVADAERAVRIVRAIHSRVRGTTPSGRPYRADDPELLGWVHAAEVDSFVSAHQAYGDEPLDDADRDTYVRQSGEVAARLGVVDPARTWAENRALLERYRPQLRLTPPARGVATMLLRRPPLTGPDRVGYGVLAAGAVAVLEPWSRAQLLLPTLPVTDRLVTRPLVRTALGTLRWALADPTGLPEPPAARSA